MTWTSTWYSAWFKDEPQRRVQPDAEPGRLPGVSVDAVSRQRHQSLHQNWVGEAHANWRLVFAGLPGAKRKPSYDNDTLIDLQCVFFSARILRETSSVPLDHDPRRSRGDVHRGRPPALGVGHRFGQGAEQARPQSSEPEIQGNINTYQNWIRFINWCFKVMMTLPKPGDANDPRWIRMELSGKKINLVETLAIGARKIKISWKVREKRFHSLSELALVVNVGYVVSCKLWGEKMGFLIYYWNKFLVHVDD